MKKILNAKPVTKNVRLVKFTTSVTSVPYTEYPIPNLIAHAQMENLNHQMEHVDLVNHNVKHVTAQQTIVLNVLEIEIKMNHSVHALMQP